jgi:sporulation protein YunB
LYNRRFRAQSKKPFSKRSIFLITMIVSFVLTIQTFLFLEHNIREPLMSVARIRVKQVATDAINQAIAGQVANSAEMEELVDRWTNQEGDLTGLALKYGEHMKISSEIVNIVNEALDANIHLEERIPIGQAFDSAILSSFGPSIPLRFESAGAPQVEIGTRQEDAGINMLLLTVYVRITAEVMIYIPFDTEPEVVATEIPISYILVKGDVPMYYFDAKGNPMGDNAGGAMLPPSVALPNSDAPADGEPQEEEASPVTETPEL